MLYNIDTSHLLTKIPFNKLRNTFTSHSIECSKFVSVNGIRYKQYFLSVCQPDREARRTSDAHLFTRSQRSLKATEDSWAGAHLEQAWSKGSEEQQIGGLHPSKVIQLVHSL